MENNHELTIALWKLRRELDMGIISIRMFLQKASELHRQHSEPKR